MPKKQTPSFVVTRRIQPDESQIKFLEDTFRLVDRLYNDVLSEAERRAEALRSDEVYKETLALYQAGRKTVQELENSIASLQEQIHTENSQPEKKRLRAERDALKQKLSNQNEILKKQKSVLSECTEKAGFSEYSLHAFAGELKKDKYDNRLGINIVQKIASDAWRAEKKVFYGEGKKVHYRKYGQSMSFEDKNASSGIIYKPEERERKHQPWEHVLVMGHPMHLKPVREQDAWLKSAMNHTVKYCRIVRKPHGARYHYFLQIVMEGKPPIKHQIGTKTVGIDPGVSTMTYYTGKELDMVNLSPQIAARQKAVKQTATVYERRRRMANPQNYNPDGTVKKDTEAFHKVWNHTKGMDQALLRLKSAYRKMHEYVKQSNGYDTNRILMETRILREESMNYTALAKRAKECKRQKKNSMVKTKQGKTKIIHKYKRRKRFGASILKHAPASFLRMLERKIHRQGGLVYELDSRSYKASQYDHTKDACEKHTLSERTKIVGGHLVQRDCYSAFLMYHASENGIDRTSCQEDFENFLTCQQRLIERLTETNGDITGNFGLRNFQTIAV